VIRKQSRPELFPVTHLQLTLPLSQKSINIRGNSILEIIRLMMMVAVSWMLRAVYPKLARWGWLLVPLFDMRPGF
jgi:hypothetical protein